MQGYRFHKRKFVVPGGFVDRIVGDLTDAFGNPTSGNYTSNSGKNIPETLTTVVATLSTPDLSILGDINYAYQMNDTANFDALMAKAKANYLDSAEFKVAKDVFD